MWSFYLSCVYFRSLISLTFASIKVNENEIFLWFLSLARENWILLWIRLGLAFQSESETSSYMSEQNVHSFVANRSKQLCEKILSKTQVYY